VAGAVRARYIRNSGTRAQPGWGLVIEQQLEVFLFSASRYCWLEAGVPSMTAGLQFLVHGSGALLQLSQFAIGACCSCASSCSRRLLLLMARSDSRRLSAASDFDSLVFSKSCCREAMRLRNFARSSCCVA